MHASQNKEPGRGACARAGCPAGRRDENPR